MFRTCLSALLPLSLSLILTGCTRNTPDSHAGHDQSEKKGGETAQDEEAKVRAGLAELDPEDRKLAEAQKFCAVEEENRLGSMGKPVKVLVKDVPVFLCCKSCKARATREPDRTLAKVADLKARAADTTK
jgi:hypothetical protein